MNDITKLALALFLISAAAGFAIGFTYQKTADLIIEQQRLSQEMALKNVLPECDTIIVKKGTSPLPPIYWEAVKDNSTIAYAFKTGARGYSSVVKCMVGVDMQMKICGLTIMEQKETPGLGTRVEEVSSKKYIWNFAASPKVKTTPWFTQQFNGLQLDKKIKINKSNGEWHAMDNTTKSALLQANSVSALTGATISTNAVIKAIEEDIFRYAEKLSLKTIVADTVGNDD